MTNKEVFRALVEFPWMVFVVYWVVGAMKTLAAREKEPFTSRSGVLLLEIIGYVLVFSGSTGIGFLGTRLFPRTMASAILGVVLTWSGIGLAVWARYHLAEYWSSRVTIKEDHQLIRSGPYSHLRHPIYSGLILATIGSALVIDEWRCALGGVPGPDWLLFQGKKRGSHAHPTIRRNLPRAPETHRLPDPAFSLKVVLGAESRAYSLFQRIHPRTQA
jgi:protein-S-isoprenylcysteine O-methyltransferase Ste14